MLVAGSGWISDMSRAFDASRYQGPDSPSRLGAAALHGGLGGTAAQSRGSSRRSYCHYSL